MLESRRKFKAWNKDEDPAVERGSNSNSNQVMRSESAGGQRRLVETRNISRKPRVTESRLRFHENHLVPPSRSHPPGELPQ